MYFIDSNGNNIIFMFFLSYMQLGLYCSYFSTCFQHLCGFVLCSGRYVDWEELEMVTKLEESKGEHSTQGICEIFLYLNMCLGLCITGIVRSWCWCMIFCAVLCEAGIIKNVKIEWIFYLFSDKAERLCGYVFQLPVVDKPLILTDRAGF